MRYSRSPTKLVSFVNRCLVAVFVTSLDWSLAFLVSLFSRCCYFICCCWVSLTSFFFNFLTEGKLLYHVVLVSALQQCESATGIHMSPPSWTHLPPHPTSLSCHRALSLSSLCHIAISHWLSVLHMVMCMFQCYSFKLSHPLFPPLCPKVCPLWPCLLCCPANRFISIPSF